MIHFVTKKAFVLPANLHDNFQFTQCHDKIRLSRTGIPPFRPAPDCTLWCWRLFWLKNNNEIGGKKKIAPIQKSMLKRGCKISFYSHRYNANWHR